MGLKLTTEFNETAMDEFEDSVSRADHEDSLRREKKRSESEMKSCEQLEAGKG